MIPRLAAPLLIGLTSCGIDASGGSFLFSVSGSADVGAAGTATLDVQILPTGSFHDDVTIGLAGAPATLTADPLTLTGGITSGKLTLHAAAGAVIDESVVITGTTRVQVAGVPVWVTAGFSTGTLDTSFGDGGRATIPFDGKCSHFLVAQPDGKLLFPDRHDTSPGQLIRLTADGQLDGTFGTNGVVTLAGTAGGPDDVVVREDGGLVAVGDDTPASASKSARLWGLRADGSPDPSVGSGGVVNLGGSTFDTVAAVDQKIFVAGSVTSGGWLGERLIAAGSVDPQYGNQGTVQLTFSAESAPAGHGAWLVAGATSAGNGALSLVSADGTVGGSVQSGRGTYTSPLVDGNQLFVMFQTQTSTGDPQVVVQRRLADLTPDPAFGTAGAASVPAPPGALHLAAVQPDGRVVVVRGPDFTGSVQVVRVGADGSADPSVHVGVSRLLGEDPHGSNDPLLCLGHALDAEGRLIVAYKYGTDGGVAHVVRLHL